MSASPVYVPPSQGVVDVRYQRELISRSTCSHSSIVRPELSGHDNYDLILSPKQGSVSYAGQARLRYVYIATPA